MNSESPVIMCGAINRVLFTKVMSWLAVPTDEEAESAKAIIH